LSACYPPMLFEVGFLRLKGRREGGGRKKVESVMISSSPLDRDWRGGKKKKGRTKPPRQVFVTTSCFGEEKGGEKKRRGERKGVRTVDEAWTLAF